MSEASPESPDPASRSFFSFTVERARTHLGQLALYFTALASMVGGFYVLTDKLGFSTWTALAVTSLPLLLVVVFETLPAWRRHRDEERLRKEGIRGELADPDFFRLRPYEEREREQFRRPDRAEVEVLHLIRASSSPLLYLTGRSGTGKSSLLNAAIFPVLAKDSWRVVSFRTFGDPLAALTDALGQAGAVWQKPPEKLEELPVRQQLERACAHLRSTRLLLVVDQFEEFLLLHEGETQATFLALLSSLVDEPVAGLTVLLAMRTDYLHLLTALDLPVLEARKNWYEIGPFTAAAARQFLTRSGLDLGSELLERVIKEGADIDETPGLVRPITLNMIGMMVGRFKGRLEKDLSEELIRSYLRQAVGAPEVRAQAPRVLRPMITGKGTKQPRSEEELVQATGLDLGVVRGCLLNLGEQGLVRRLDPIKGVWEVSHDFIARLLGQILAGWREIFVRRVRPWVAPVSLALWLLMIFVAIPDFLNRREQRAIQKLMELRINVRLNEGDHSATAEDPKISDIDEICKQLARLSNLRKFSLSNTKVIDLSPMEQLKNLQFIDLSSTPAPDLTSLEQLKNLEIIDLSRTPASDLKPLEKLKRLHTLNLNFTQVSDLTPLTQLTRLKALELDSTGVSNLTSLALLVNLQTLTLRSTQLSDLTPLARLTNLQTLDLGSTQISDLSPLAQLTNLQTLDLGSTQVSDLTPLVKLTKLQALYLDATLVSDLTPLARATDLQELYLQKTSVTNLAPVAQLPKLKTLISHSQVSQ